MVASSDGKGSGDTDGVAVTLVVGVGMVGDCGVRDYYLHETGNSTIHELR